MLSKPKKGNGGLAKPFSKIICAGQNTCRSIPSRSDETRNFDFSFAFSRKRKPFFQMQEATLCQTLTNSVEKSYCKRSHPRQTSDRRSLDVDSAPERKDMDKLECEQWPQVTRFRHWKTSFRREVLTGSTHRQAQPGCQTSTRQNQRNIWMSDLYSAAPG